MTLTIYETAQAYASLLTLSEVTRELGKLPEAHCLSERDALRARREALEARKRELCAERDIAARNAR